MIVAPASSPAMTPESKRPFRLRLGFALTALMLLAVLSTALIVHASWSWTASRNIETVVGSLSRQTADAVGRELQATFHGVPYPRGWTDRNGRDRRGRAERLALSASRFLQADPGRYLLSQSREIR